MRGKQAVRRESIPDAKYNHLLVAKLINQVMKDGKKTTAERIVYTAFDRISDVKKASPVEVFETAMNNVMPNVEVKSKRVGGANYQIPMPVRGERRIALGFRWILEAARSRKGAPMAERLAKELLEAADGVGSAVKKREDVQRMAEANRAFAHFVR
jgi:small subunit ribosomal protein S7